MYSIVCYGDKSPNGVGCSTVMYSSAPWKWLAILRARAKMKKDKSIFYAEVIKDNPSQSYNGFEHREICSILISSKRRT